MTLPSADVFSQLLGYDASVVYWDLASLPLGIRSATLMSRLAYWSSWADCLGMVQQRHRTVSACIVEALNHQHPSFHLAGLRVCGAQLAAVGFHAPSWEELAHGVRPEPVVWDADFDPGLPLHGWQRIATIPVHGELVEGCVRPRLSQSEQALFRSQGGPLSSVPFTCFPTSPLTRFDASLFRVLFLRRLWLPLPPSSRFCRCGRLLDVLGHHCAVCAQAGVLGRRRYALESAAARICREAGARVTTNVMVRDLDLLPLHQVDALADGLPLFHGAQVALDTTLVSPLRQDGTPHVRCAVEDGVASKARRRKERTYPELSGAHGRARLVVLACDSGSLPRPRYSHSARLACCGGGACASARAFALSLLEGLLLMGTMALPPRLMK